MNWQGPSCLPGRCFWLETLGRLNFPPRVPKACSAKLIAILYSATQLSSIKPDKQGGVLV
jgi:hypothetical protein